MNARFRELALPGGIAGHLFLHAMPGREETWGEFLDEAARVGLDLLVCLAEESEIRSKSPAYFHARTHRLLPFPTRDFSIQDFDAPRPEERTSFQELVQDVARAVRGGGNVLVHCRMGIGRTGVLATCVLLELGIPSPEALRVVKSAGSSAEALTQREFLAWYSSLYAG